MRAQMDETLRARVVGQDHVVRAVSDAVRMSRAGLQAPDRPVASFLFLGPTGVGKTELCKALAGFLFDDESRGLYAPSCVHPICELIVWLGLRSTCPSSTTGIPSRGSLALRRDTWALRRAGS
jgi:MoxR-like ATPase